MNLEALRTIGLTENEIKIYVDLLKSGSSTAYEIGKRTGIYRVHVYDKLEQLMNKGLVTHIYRGAKKFFQATPPSKILQHLEDKKRELEGEEEGIISLLPELEKMASLPKEDTFVEVFKGKEGLKYFLKDIIKTIGLGKEERKKGKKEWIGEPEVLITGIDDQKYQETLPIFMPQYFRDLKNKGIRERVITAQRKGIFLFDKALAPTTTYRFLEAKQFNPTNTFIYGNKVVIVTWGSPVTAVMIKNNEIAETYRNHFEHLWKVARKKL